MTNLVHDRLVLIGILLARGLVRHALARRLLIVGDNIAGGCQHCSQVSREGDEGEAYRWTLSAVSVTPSLTLSVVDLLLSGVTLSPSLSPASLRPESIVPVLVDGSWSVGELVLCVVVCWMWTDRTELDVVKRKRKSTPGQVKRAF